MSRIITFYYYMCVAVGLINLHYDSKTKSLQLYHWGTILYVGVNNIIVLVFQPYSLILFLNTIYECQQYEVEAIVSVFIAITDSLALSATIIAAWLKRKRFRTNCYVFGMLVQQYLSETKLNENQEFVRRARNILIRKIILSLGPMSLLYVHLYNRLEGDEYCAFMDDPHYIVATIYMGFLRLILIFLDFTLILGFVFIDLCLNMLMNNLKRIKHDVNRMNRVYAKGYGEKQKNVHRIWRLHLSADVEAITNEVKKLQALARDHTDMYKVSILFMLLTVFLTFTLFVFGICKYYADIDTFHTYVFIYLLIVLVVAFSNSLVLFNVCESLTEDSEKISNEVYNIVLEASLINRGTFYRDPLEISLETLSLHLRGQEFKVSICGLFDLHHMACMGMISAIYLHLSVIEQTSLEAENFVYELKRQLAENNG